MRQYPPNSLLGLPKSIRQTIFVYAGLFHNHDIPLNAERWSLTESEHLDLELPYKEDLRSTYALLLTCKRSYIEVAAYIYSKNRVLVCHESLKQLWPLRVLLPSSIGSLTELVIHRDTGEVRKGHNHEPRIPLSYWSDPQQSPSDEAVREEHSLGEWEETAKFLAQHLPEGKTRLLLFWDVHDRAAAQRVVAALRDFPRLRSCRIRLSKSYDREIRELVFNAARRAENVQLGLQQFPFFRLPPELRRRVLEFSNLITPEREVQWIPGSGFWVGLGGRCDIVVYHPMNPLKAPELMDNHCVVGCFCPAFHSTSMPLCQCWTPPWPLFLVCKAMVVEASAVFYGCNRFVIRPRRIPERGLPLDHPFTMCFSSERSSQWFRGVRSLDLVLSQIILDGMEADSARTATLSEAVEVFKSRIQLSTLTLRIYLACHPYSDNRDKIRSVGDSSSSEQGVLITIYDEICEALAPLKSLQQIYIHLHHDACCWPYADFGDPDEFCSIDPDSGQLFWRRAPYYSGSAARLRDLEVRLEKRLMGPDYDSSHLGKAQDLKSDWLSTRELLGW